MASKNKLIAVKYDHKIIGIYIFFSIAGIRRLGDIIAHIQHNDEEKELAIRDLIHLHNKLVAAISSNEDSVFAHEQVKYCEINNCDLIQD